MMMYLNLRRSTFLLSLCLPFGFNGVFSQDLAIAKTVVVDKKASQTTGKIIYQPSTQFSGRGQVGGKDGGGPRGCSLAQKEAKESLLALVPSQGIGLTTSLTPTVWVYSPYQISKSVTAKLIVRQSNNAGGEIGTETTLKIPSTPGIFPVSITQPIENNKAYQWFLTIECDSDAAANPFISGWIGIVKQSDSKYSPSLEVSARQGYWYDVLNQLITTQSKTKTAQIDLADFLRSGGLEAAVNKPIVKLSTKP
jgi:hypothetical protein